MMRFVEPSGEVSVFRERSNNSNGNTVDNQGRLVTCEHLTRRVTRTEIDGSISVIADKWNGKRLNSPNDVVVKSDDSIWFTDPAYGIDTDYEGDRAHAGDRRLPRLSRRRANPARSPPSSPTWFGRTASPSRRTRNTSMSPTPARRTRRTARATSAASRSTRTEPGCRAARSSPSPARACTTGFASTATAASGPAAPRACIATTADGTLIGKILIPEMVANVTFGGAKLNRLFICGTTSLYSIYVTANGSKLG